MLFNSFIFFFIFAPLFFLALTQTQKISNNLGVLVLCLFSIAFYAWTEFKYLPLLLSSIAINYTIGIKIIKSHLGVAPAILSKKQLLALGVSANLLILAYYKYSPLILLSLEQATGHPVGLKAPPLPIGISFFTFTQIAFLVDAYYGKVRDRHVGRYTLFVTFFPHLIAGPILHHAQMMPQFSKPSMGQARLQAFFAGGGIFLVGLIKKVVLADGAAQFVEPVFKLAGQMPLDLSCQDAWLGTMAYTLQLYFDFSGYTDMAIGLSRMMGITLPENFNSPYKSTSISDFWRRWHMSLSNFLRDYLYIPLGGNRKGPRRQTLNLMITMLLGGLWHGAAWNFLAWGGLHGFYLVINHFWAHQVKGKLPSFLIQSLFFKVFCWLLTLLAVMVGWVFFRAENFSAAFHILNSLQGATAPAVRHLAFSTEQALVWIIPCAAIAFLMPNTMHIRNIISKQLSQMNIKHQNLVQCVGLGFILAMCCLLVLVAESAAGRSPFIYFSF
jgi:alginate O-acetyltransferase complex protein AlgI